MKRFLGTALITGLCVMTAPVGAVAAKPKCGKRPATLVGTKQGDKLKGTRGPDVIVAGAGDDQIQGLDGDDRLCGGPGDDVLNPGAGDDRTEGGGGADQIDEGGGLGALIGGPGDDTLVGGRGNDQISGGPGDDTLIDGHSQASDCPGVMPVGFPVLYCRNLPIGPLEPAPYFWDDFLEGGPGDDVLKGGIGPDLLSGDAGDDFLSGGPGTDGFGGGTGRDTCVGGPDRDFREEDVGSTPGKCEKERSIEGEDMIDITAPVPTSFTIGPVQPAATADPFDRATIPFVLTAHDETPVQHAQITLFPQAGSNFLPQYDGAPTTPGSLGVDARWEGEITVPNIFIAGTYEIEVLLTDDLVGYGGYRGDRLANLGLPSTVFVPPHGP